MQVIPETPGKACEYMPMQVPRSLAPIKKDHLRPKSTVYTSTNNRLGWELVGTGGDWGFRGGDRGQGTYTWRRFTMNKQPFWGPGTGDLYMETFYNEQTTI